MKLGRQETAKPGPTWTNINTASASELEQLPGIGPALAARILDDRARRGAYSRPGDLVRVKGIGPKTFEKLEPYLVVGGIAANGTDG